MRKISADDMAGMDISGYDEGIDCEDAAARGIKIAYVKASEGSDFKDSCFRAHTAALSRLGIKTGAYHFFRFYQVSTAQAQAENFLECITGVRLDCAPAVDCEDGGLACGLSAEEATGQVLDFARAVEQATGARPIFYSNTAFISAHFTRDIARLGAWIADLRDPAGPGENGVTDDWVGFQYSFCGSVGGKTVDLDRFRPGVLLASPLCFGSGAAQAPAEPSRPECDPAVAAYQRKLGRLMIPDDSGSLPEADGIDGPRTKQAVRRFESIMALDIDGGIWGPQCEGAYELAAVSRPELSAGSEGRAVCYIQFRLGGLAVDGIFGPLTLASVKAWQSSHGLAPDGIVGPLTWGTLI